jgi:hypothetical protein
MWCQLAFLGLHLHLRPLELWIKKLTSFKLICYATKHLKTGISKPVSSKNEKRRSFYNCHCYDFQIQRKKRQHRLLKSQRPTLPATLMKKYNFELRSILILDSYKKKPRRHMDKTVTTDFCSHCGPKFDSLKRSWKELWFWTLIKIRIKMTAKRLADKKVPVRHPGDTWTGTAANLNQKGFKPNDSRGKKFHLLPNLGWFWRSSRILFCFECC